MFLFVTRFNLKRTYVREHQNDLSTNLYLSIYVPKWYFTSPEPSSAACKPANWVNNWWSGLRQTFASTFRRPRCGIPITMLSTPNSVDLSITDFIAGIRISHPSRPNLFSEDHFLAKKDSKLELKMIQIHQIFFEYCNKNKWGMAKNCIFGITLFILFIYNLS